VFSPYVGRATSICGGWNNPAKLRSSWVIIMLPNLATDRISCHLPMNAYPLSTLIRVIPDTLPETLNA
jgi:hypothetical protein